MLVILKSFNFLNKQGVNTSYVYFGSSGSFFPFHIEDNNLGSINRQYSGASKIWLSISRINFNAFVEYLK